MIFHGMTGRYERNGIFDLEAVLPYIGEGTHEFNGDLLSLDSHRLLLFKQNIVCVTCGLEGLYFAKERCVKRNTHYIKGGHGLKIVTFSLKERNGELPNWHLNLYGMREDGREVMITKDHIMPRSKGGQDVMWNYQTMCQWCNSRKGCKIPLAMSTYAGA